MTTKLLSPKTLPNPVQMLIRPILFVAVAAHALLLFVPLPSEEKPKEPDDKKNPVKITQLPTAKPPEPKAKPKTTATPTKTVAVSAKSGSPTTSSSTATVPSLPSLPEATTATSTVQSQPLPPSDKRSNPPQRLPSALPPKLTTEDPEQALYKLLAELPAATNDPGVEGSNPSNVAPLDELPQMELFFKPIDSQAVDLKGAIPEGLPGLTGSPLLTLFPLEENLNLNSFYAKSLEPKLKAIFSSITLLGDYGDGSVYKLTRGTYTAYLSLMPPKQAVGAIISVWSKDPRSPSTQAGN